MQLSDIKEVRLVNLARREDRLNVCLERWPNGLPRPSVFPAIDGDLVPFPRWWKQGKGAWGCMLSHIRIMEDYLNQGLKGPLAIFEDDVMFCPDFKERANEFLAKVPEVWDFIYFGGQHLKPASEHCPGVMKAVNVNRTHAFMLHEDAVAEVYAWLCEWPLHAKQEKRHHVDHRLGQIHGNMATYCPKDWLCAQRASWSDIKNNHVRTKVWGSADWTETKMSKEPIVMIAAPFRTGSSALAGILQRLGVKMGDRWQTAAGYVCPKGSYEDLEIARKLRGFFDQTTGLMKPDKDRNQLMRALTAWAEATKEVAGEGASIGVKHGLLCLCVDEAVEAFGPDTKIITIERDWGQQQQSIDRMGDWCTERGVRAQIDTAKASLAKYDHMVIDSDDIWRDPIGVSRRIADWLGKPYNDQAVAEWVDPILRNFE